MGKIRKGINGLKWLSNASIKQIHEESLEILWERGMEIKHPRALTILADAGAQIDEQTGLVRFPPELVENCLAKLPKEFVLGARKLDGDIKMGSNIDPFVRPSTGAEGYVDPETRVRRLGTLTDLKDWICLVNSLNNINICAGFHPCNVPLEMREAIVAKTMMENSTKHLLISTTNYESMKAIIDMGIAVRGSKKAMKERPPFSWLSSSTAPSKVMEYCIDNLLVAGEYGIPVEVNTTPLMGATSPITIAGCLLQTNLEILALIVVSQVANPGTPLIYRGITMALDMATGMGISSSMECGMAQAALAQLVREKYEIPVSSFGMATSSMTADGQSQIERTALIFLAALSGTSLLVGAGHIEDNCTADPVQLIIDDEIVGLVSRVLGGFNVNKETLAKDLIMKIIPGQDYLSEEHTLKHLRSEHLRPNSFNRDSRANWEGSGEKDLNCVARDRALNLIRNDQNVLLDEHVKKEINAIYKSLEKGKPSTHPRTM